MPEYTFLETPSNTPYPPQPQASEHSKINWKYQFQQYGFAIGVALVLFAVFSVYLYFRRGYYDLYIANKVFAGNAAMLFGTVLLLGPLTRFFKIFDHYLQFRKELGIVGFFLALFHGFASYFLLSDHFPREKFFTSGLWPFVYGIAATVLLFIIFVISNKKAMHLLGGKTWVLTQSWGIRISFVMVALHVGVMKWSSWVSWYQKGGSSELVHPEWPGAGLLVGWFMAFVLFIRAAELINKNFGRYVWYISVVTLPLVYIFTFWWGQRFL